MTLFGKRRAHTRRLDEVECYLDETREKVKMQTPQINALTAWLQDRKKINGLGADFEWTLATPKGRTR